MRKSFKSYLRHPLSKKPTVTGPSGPEIVEVTILPQWDTVLRYDGSPLMVDDMVTDPNGQSVVRGENQSYRDLDENGNQRNWIAIGLATDNEAIDEFRSPKEHPNANDGNPDNDGVVYTNIGPTRSVLSFNLEDIPAGAIIEEAFLELIPVTDKSADDVWDEFDDINNVWPSGGVPCEVLNLVEKIEDTCTWNTTKNTLIQVEGVNYPIPENRWYRQEDSETIPNPIGAAQNSKRWDIQEPDQSFLDQYSGEFGGNIADDVELYGHIGYGEIGGGAVENVPEDKSELDQFDIVKEAHEDQHDGDNQIDEVSITAFENIDVARAVRYAHAEQNRTCNLLLRASHWTETDLTEDQTEEIFEPNPLSLESISLEDETDTDDDNLDTDVELDHNAIVRFDPPTFDTDGDPGTPETITWVEKAAQDGWNVTYDWQVKYPAIVDFNFDINRNGVKIADQSTRGSIGGDDRDLTIEFVAGDVLTVTNISSTGGFENEHIFEFYLDGVGGGLDNPLTITESDVPEGPEDPSLEVKCLIGARAQGANTGDGNDYFPQTFSEIVLGSVFNDPTDDDEVDITPTFSLEFTPPAVGDDFESPIDLTTPHTVHVKFTIENIRPGFDWTAPESPATQVIYSKAISVTEIPAEGTAFVGTPSNDVFTIDGTSATNEFDVTFTGQDLIDDNSSQIEAGDSLVLSINVGYLGLGTDQGLPYVDIFQEQAAQYTFSIAEENTEFNADIVNPNMRRGVFTTTNLRGPLRNNSGTGQNTNLKLLQPESFAKTNMFQRELAPCQLDCGDGGVFNTALLPIEEQSRFAGIQATKNKFSLLNLNVGVSLSFDESVIQDTDGNVPTIPGNAAAVVSLITSGGAGEMVTRQRNGVNIVLPSDLAVYYYDDRDGQVDIGWVYYRAISKKLTPDDTDNNIPADAFSDYTVNDFDVTNTDDGLKYIGWEKLSGDSGNLINNITANLDNPNIGAHLFLLDNRYDFVETPTNLELQDPDKWPVPFTEAFPLGRVGGTNTPEPTGLEARNNPSLFETFPQDENELVLSNLSSVLSVVQWKINSLDSGTSEQQIANPSLIRTVEGAEQQPDAGSDIWDDPCPALSIVGTRDTVVTGIGQVQPLPDDKSLFVSLNSVDPSGGIEFRTFHDDPDTGLGLFRDGINSGVPTGAEMDADPANSEYCNLKSHFWNGLGLDINNEAEQPFTTNDSGLAGTVALFWRRKDDCGLNSSTGDRYFKDRFENSIRVTSDLDRPFKNGASEEDAYHGINIGYGQFHQDYIDTQRNEDIPVLEYIVEVIRGGSVYHRDIYRLANAQTEWSQERTVAERCFPCLSDDRDITEDCSGNAADASGGGQPNKADTLYQVGTDGTAWKEGWYNPSDWRAGDTIRIYAIQPRVEGDQVVVDPGDPFGSPADIRVVGTDIEPTPLIQRIKKFCPVGDPWDPRPDCCIDEGTNECQDGTICIISSSVPGLGGDGIPPDTQ